jgi:hypothetical protein
MSKKLTLIATAGARVADNENSLTIAIVIQGDPCHGRKDSFAVAASEASAVEEEEPAMHILEDSI